MLLGCFNYKIKCLGIETVLLNKTQNKIIIARISLINITCIRAASLTSTA